MCHVSVSKARGQLPQLIETSRKETVFLEKHGKCEAVMINPKYYEKLLEALEEFEDTSAFDLAMEEEGENVDWEQAKIELGWE